MNGTAQALIIIALIIGAFILYKWLKPYCIRYDSTLCITGGLGSGKTLHATKVGRVLIIKQRLTKYYIFNFFRKISNKIKRSINKKHLKYNLIHCKDKNFKQKKIYNIPALRKKPMLYTNYPVHFKSHIFGRKREWSKPITADVIACFRTIEEYSVVIIDEMPQFVNQFNWNEEIIQKNVNEFITFFRHYIGGYFICTAQSTDDIVVQIRRKLNQAIWCFDFHKWFFGLFYTVRMCDIMLSDQVSTMSTTFIEDNTKLHFGLFPKKGTYDTRCYSERYKNAYIKDISDVRYKKVKTNKIIRLQQYISPLDDTTSELQKADLYKQGERIWKN